MQDWTNAVTDAFAFGWILSIVFLMIAGAISDTFKEKDYYDQVRILFVILWLVIASVVLII